MMFDACTIDGAPIRRPIRNRRRACKRTVWPSSAVAPAHDALPSFLSRHARYRRAGGQCSISSCFRVSPPSGRWPHVSCDCPRTLIAKPLSQSTGIRLRCRAHIRFSLSWGPARQFALSAPYLSPFASSRLSALVYRQLN
jgi:hypothetical protein